MSIKAFQAWAGNSRTTKESPQAAAIAFFEAHPKKRKCNVTEGTYDGTFFTVTYGRKSEGQWPLSWKDVTKKTAHDLPATVQ